MERFKITGWLKITTIAIAIFGLLFFCAYVPALAKEYRVMYPEYSSLYEPMLFGIWGMGAICFYALYQFYRICCEIGKNNSFSEVNAKSMKKISFSAFLLAIASVILFFVLAFQNCMNGGLILLFAMLVFLFVAGGILTYALSCLIMNAAKLQEENDFTI